ncbi:MAG: hypothetical protein A3G18_07165 [Rhodospirillales bacterium RIFCSPLOWO2_12_FULL_58_28]|nr:MAG: hypothetical protein A3H92_11720 [Rhodospirillales bacterium RIFCSPLOWO2_02_FULL_58_16]OHC78651.1 MAG: hypothetical protein A3G18_07165 [Rhodospirillales bacterium RIFCSPLOWO2_12_FULL_58_28]
MKLTVRGFVGAIVLAAAIGVFTQGTARAGGEFTDAKVEAYVTASIAIDTLINKWGPKIDAAKSEEEANKMKEQANGELVAAIDKVDGINSNEYQALADVAATDPNMQQRLKKAFEKRMGK